jgi:16S rRNA (cytidine1402-2'-O)-methyltransferase
MNVGKLYMVTTPIGNLEDITLRALRILKEVDLIAAEDTRHTRKLLSHFEISTPMTSLHAHNEHRKVESLIEKILSGSIIASVSDAGTPCIADPGFLIVREALKAGIEPIVIPGVSALTFAVVAAGLPCDSFAFYGFMPVKSGRKLKTVQKIGQEERSVFFYESPHRITKTLKLLAETLGPDIQTAIVREATKLHEETIHGTAGELAEKYADHKWKGECVMAVAPQLIEKPDKKEGKYERRKETSL